MTQMGNGWSQNSNKGQSDFLFLWVLVSRIHQPSAVPLGWVSSPDLEFILMWHIVFPMTTAEYITAYAMPAKMIRGRPVA